MNYGVVQQSTVLMLNHIVDFILQVSTKRKAYKRRYSYSSAFRISIFPSEDSRHNKVTQYEQYGFSILVSFLRTELFGKLQHRLHSLYSLKVFLYSSARLKITSWMPFPKMKCTAWYSGLYTLSSLCISFQPPLSEP